MTEITFTLQQLPTNKWRLTQSMTVAGSDPFEQDRGVYDSPALAHEAVKIILNPKYYYYDPNGDEIKDHKQPD